MFSGGDQEEVQRWLGNFAVSHAKRENPRVEALVEEEGAGDGARYVVGLRLGDRMAPPPGAEPLSLSYPEVRDQRGSLAWCQALAGRVRALARQLVSDEPTARRSA